MKIKVRCEAVGAVEARDWIALPRASHAEPAWEDKPTPAAAEPAPPAGVPARVRPGIARAVIGDELRTPIARCEMPSCISRYADRAALGEADIRARAIAAGWRVDGLGRLACRECQQGSPLFWATQPVVPWDRDTAITMAFQMTATARGHRRPAAVESGSGCRRAHLPRWARIC